MRHAWVRQGARARCACAARGGCGESYEQVLFFQFQALLFELNPLRLQLCGRTHAAGGRGVRYRAHAFMHAHAPHTRPSARSPPFSLARGVRAPGIRLNSPAAYLELLKDIYVLHGHAGRLHSGGEHRHLTHTTPTNLARSVAHELIGAGRQEQGRDRKVLTALGVFHAARLFELSVSTMPAASAWTTLA